MAKGQKRKNPLPQILYYIEGDDIKWLKKKTLQDRSLIN